MKYIFRGYTVLDWNPETGKFENTEYNLDYCKLIDEDYDLLVKYFETIKKYRIHGPNIVTLEDIEVY